MLKQTGVVLGGLAAGALLMYILDPTSGSNRRLAVRKGVVGAARKSARGVAGAARTSARGVGKLDGNWHPAVRALVGAGATYLAVRSLRRGGPLGLGLGTLGLGAATRAAVNRPLRQWNGARDGRPVAAARVTHAKPLQQSSVGVPAAARV
jgi:hypothetical protein